MGGSGIERREIAYRPLASQQKFHDSTARFKGFSGPIGSGKSQALCQEAIKLSYLNAGRLGLLGAPTYPMLRDATQAALLEVLDANGIPYDLNKAENALLMKDSGSRILFRSVEEFERLRGTNLAWFGVDELTYTQEESWLRLEGRLRDPLATRLCGFAVWTPKGYDWVWRRFIADRVKGYEVVQAAAFENRHILAKIPDFYERLLSSYDQKFYEQEVLGNYLSMDGSRVYTAFDRTMHLKELAVHPRHSLLWALDFNVDPMSSVVAQHLNGMVHVVDEIVIRHATTKDACAEFLRRFPKHGAGVHVFGDASGSAQQTTGLSDFDLVREYFMANSTVPVYYRVARSNPPVRERVNLVNGRLQSASGRISVLVDPKCKELIKDLEQVCYKADSMVIDKERDRARTHVSDALGYLLWQEFRPQVMVGERGEILPTW
jgi:Terminase large subunit, T4likevirus-type, N-terminal